MPAVFFECVSSVDDDDSIHASYVFYCWEYCNINASNGANRCLIVQYDVSVCLNMAIMFWKPNETHQTHKKEAKKQF